MNTPRQDRIGLHEGSVALPAGFEDRTANLFVPADPETSPNLSIARDWLKDGEALGAYVDRQLAVLKQRLAGHKLLTREPAVLGVGDSALTGERIDSSFKNGTRTVRQRQAAFVVAERRALIFTASSPKPFDEAFEVLWRDWLASFVPPPTAPAEPLPEPTSE